MARGEESEYFEYRARLGTGRWSDDDAGLGIPAQLNGAVSSRQNCHRWIESNGRCDHETHSDSADSEERPLGARYPQGGSASEQALDAFDRSGAKPAGSGCG